MNVPSATTAHIADPLPAAPTPRRKFWWLVLLGIATHVALVFLFGTKKAATPRAVINQPLVQLAADQAELLELDNPTLVALPNPHDFFAAVWQAPRPNAYPSFQYQESPQWLTLDSHTLGGTFTGFLQTNRFDHFTPDFKPAAALIPVTTPAPWDLPNGSTYVIRGPLAARPLLNAPPLPVLALNDVLDGSRVQVLVDGTGVVISAVLIPSDTGFETASHADSGDTQALTLARQFKFSPAPAPQLGEIDFHWQSQPQTTTNTP